jgi:thiol-disulfide isomerase/thioredoxin
MIKKILSLLIGLFFLVEGVQAQTTRIPDFPDVGETMPAYPAVEWIKGKGITSFDKDKIYIVELWATWCVPCIKAMPHIVELQQKFKDKNIVFIAQDVLENDKEKVIKFVQNKKELTGILVGYAGTNGSDFDRRWIKAAGIASIPQTFIIQDNKLMWQTMPNVLNEKVLQLLVDRKFTIDAAKALANKSID